MNLVNFKWDQDQDGIVTLVWDTPDKQVNVLSMAAIAELTQVAEAIAKEPAIKGLVLTSGKPGGFSAGADLDEMSAYAGQGGADAGDEQSRCGAAAGPLGCVAWRGA
jgi:3-hydroxyacyl-CoA dehydrogenase/enoyl-CoA hydratase/3-hydroxybutyryl-CoA epimerase